VKFYESEGCDKRNNRSHLGGDLDPNFSSGVTGGMYPCSWEQKSSIT